MQSTSAKCLRNDYIAHILSLLLMLLVVANVIIMELSAKSRMTDFWGGGTPPFAPLWFAFIELLFTIALLRKLRKHEASKPYNCLLWAGILIIGFLAILAYNIRVLSDILYVA